MRKVKAASNVKARKHSHINEVRRSKTSEKYDSGGIIRVWSERIRLN